MSITLTLVAVCGGLIFACLYSNIGCEVFTAMADVEKLITTEHILVESLDKYIRQEEERLDKLKKLKEVFTQSYNAANNDSNAFLSNPVNAFLLVKHLTSDWNETKRLLNNSESHEAMTYLLLRNGLFPNKADLQGAAESLMRLQQFYLLDVPTLASGQIKGLSKSKELTASDCFELGKRAYDAGWSNFSLHWMQETISRLDSEEIYQIGITEVMEYMAYAAYEIGNFSFGLNLTHQITKLDPDYPRLFDNLKYYQAKFAEFEHFSKEDPSILDPSMSKELDVDGRLWSEREMLDSYERLCRDESVQANSRSSDWQLNCYYETNNDDYFLLGPFKVEIISFDPRIVRFYDVITDSEINRTKALATPMLERAVVQDTITGEIEETTDRISKSTVLEDFHHKVVARINRRIQDISGLTVETAEPIHIINYGIGGHYDPHFDFAQSAEGIEMFRQLGNRMATWIFYMSDVAAGGSTVFPLIGVNMKPVKGSAGFWYNLKASGEGDKRTLHAACPVLSGSKWVGNKWLHEFGNEFRRPCSLDSEK